MDAVHTGSTVLLIGFGKLGRRLAPSLTSGGASVVAVRRSAVEPPSGVRILRADVRAPVLPVLPRADRLIVTLPPGESGDYRRVLQSIRTALPELPERTVFVSSTGVFAGASDDRMRSESDEPTPSTDRALELLDGERAARELFGAVIVRPAGIYGEGREFLIRRVREGVSLDHRRWTNRIHEVDLVRVLDRVLWMGDPPALVHAVDGVPARLGAVAGFIAERLGVPLPPKDPEAMGGGHRLDGGLVQQIMGPFVYPSYVDGYSEMLPAR